MTDHNLVPHAHSDLQDWKNIIINNQLAWSYYYLRAFEKSYLTLLPCCRDRKELDRQKEGVAGCYYNKDVGCGLLHASHTPNVHVDVTGPAFTELARFVF